MVMSRPSVDLTTLFLWISLDKGVKEYSVHIYLGWNIVYTGGGGMGDGVGGTGYNFQMYFFL